MAPLRPSSAFVSMPSTSGTSPLALAMNSANALACPMVPRPGVSRCAATTRTFPPLPRTVTVAATATRRCFANGSSKAVTSETGSVERIALPRSSRS
jgi:hypothetical protein